MRVGGYGALSNGEAWFKDISMEKLASHSGHAVDFSLATVSAADNAADEDESTEGDFPESGRVMLAVLATVFFGAIIYGRFIETEQLTLEASRMGTARSLPQYWYFAFIVRVVCSLVFYGHRLI